MTRMALLSASEVLAIGRCPDCNGKLAGPRDGDTRDMFCRQCHECFSVTWFSGHIVWWRRIENKRVR